MTTEAVSSGETRTRTGQRRGSRQPGGLHNDENLVRNAFLRRAGHAVEHLARNASVEALAAALEAPTDFGAVARALGHSAMPEPALELDPFADALARGAEERERLGGLAGGLLSAAAMGRILGGISRQAVDKRRRANQLLAVRQGGDWRYPAVQLGKHGQVPDPLPSVLAQAEASGMSGWALLDMLLAPDAALGGKTPLEALRAGGTQATTVLRIMLAAGTDAFG